MITNDRQYRITKSRIQDLEHALNESSNADVPENVHPNIFEAQKKAIQSQLQELLSDVHEYEALKAGKILITTVKNLQELPTILIKARIANGLTQLELAKLLDVKEQQIQKYEAELYNTASLNTLLKIAEKLGVIISGEAQLKAIETSIDREELNINNYPFKEMVKRGWFGNWNSLNEAVNLSSSLLFQHFDKAGLANLEYGLTKKSVRSGSTFNQHALNAWYARIIIEAKEQITDRTFDKEFITASWIKDLAVLSKDKDGPRRAANHLIHCGIRFVTEPPLEGTFLDGAALLIERESPVIALTLRHDRLDNFWFVLFHELAHVILHLGSNIDAIFDDLDTIAEGIENEADSFALNALIPDEVWRKSLVRFNPTKEAIINQAEKLHVHPALVAGRIRRETGKYYQFNDLIGQGQVRSNFITKN
jgi:HTH-type transcriptional regulator/antitoxin HigA